MPDPLAAIEAARAAGVAAVNQACDAAVNIVVGATTFDLSDQLDKSKSGVSLYAAAKYAQSRPFVLRALNNWSLAGNGATVHYTGPQDPRWAFDWQGACDTTAMSDLTFVNDGAPANGDKGITLFHPGGNGITVRNVHAVAFADNWNGEQHPTHVLIDGFSNEKASGFLIYGGGEDHDYRNLVSEDSTRESNVRLVGLKRFKIAGGRLWNKDRRPLSEPLNYAKSVLRVENGCEDGDISGLEMALWLELPGEKLVPTGANPVSLNPLGGDDGLGDKAGGARRITLRNCKVHGPIGIGHGAEDITVANNDLIWSDAQFAAFLIGGYDPAYDRTVQRVKIANNLLLSDTGRAQFIAQIVNGKFPTGAKDISITGNGLVCPGWKIDEGGTGSMIARLGEFAPVAFSGNRWPTPTWGYVDVRTREVAQGGSEWRSLEQWAQQTGDTFAPTDEAGLRAAGIGVRP
jgi:hypothetical protein